MSIVSEAHVDDVPEGKHVFVTLDATGDTRLDWNPNNPDEVENARATFDLLVGQKRMAAYAVRANGQPGEVIRTFDPNVEKMIFAPPMRGG